MFNRSNLVSGVMVLVSRVKGLVDLILFVFLWLFQRHVNDVSRLLVSSALKVGVQLSSHYYKLCCVVNFMYCTLLPLVE